MKRFGLRALLVLLGSCWSWHTVMAQDSVRVIDEVEVRSRIRYHETIEPQTLKGEELERVNAHSVADALRLMSGVQLKDYGGIGGLKTVNLRSLGSQHVGIYYDGVELGNAQNGVIDLGQFSLDNVEEVSVYQGQRSAIMQSASDFANAGSLYIRTQRPRNLTQLHPQHFRLKMQTGASRLLRLSALYERRMSERVTLSANVESLTSDGRYEFRYRRRNMDGSIAYDTTATRQNGDIQALRAEVNLYGQMERGYWNAKAYTYHSWRGIPGAIVNNVWRRGERQGDHNTFVQAAWHRDMTERYTLRLLAKGASYRTHYLNKDTTQLMVDSHYRQQEAYASIINVVEIRPWWSVSLDYDVRYNRLSSDIPQFAHPRRWSHLVALASAMDLGSVQLQGSVVESWVRDVSCVTCHEDNRPSSSMHTTRTERRLTPALFASYRPTTWMQLTAFAKKSFRMPTFNDLYYTNFGNALLTPESAIQYDLGMRIEGKAKHGFSAEKPLTGSVEVHAYHNAVHDKIVAYPKGQQFRWTMLNLGRVHIDGIDVQGQLSWQLMQELKTSARVQYTYQRARDVTDRNTSYYGHQIPYTPWHSGSVTVMLDWKTWDIAYNFVYTGERYSQQENIAYNHVEPWYTSDLHIAWRHRWGNGLFKATLEVNNLLDQQYDVILNSPMPGRTFNLTLLCEI